VLVAYKRVHDAIGALDDTDVRASSLLPGWTRGHRLTHIARNADSVVRRLDGALRGELVSQYDGGRKARAAAIDEGAGRSSVELSADVHKAVERLDDLFRSAPDDVWDRAVLDNDGREMLRPHWCSRAGARSRRIMSTSASATRAAIGRRAG
jgi:maleylpyruvate isomerase